MALIKVCNECRKEIVFNNRLLHYVSIPGRFIMNPKIRLYIADQAGMPEEEYQICSHECLSDFIRKKAEVR